jgi:hypothetical protein
VPEDPPTPKIKFYEALDDAWRSAGSPKPKKISELVGKLRRPPARAGQPVAPVEPAPDLSESTIRGWFPTRREAQQQAGDTPKHRCLPRDEDDLLLVLTVLRALSESRQPPDGSPGRGTLSTEEKDHWRTLLRKAHADKNSHAGDQQGGATNAPGEQPPTQPRPTGTITDDDPTVGHGSASQQDAADGGTRPASTTIFVVQAPPPPPSGTPAAGGPTEPPARLGWLHIHRTAVTALIVLVLFAVGACALLVWLWNNDEHPPVSPVSCAYVIKEPAEVYSEPDAKAKTGKSKIISEGVTVLGGPRPQGWVPVSTPRDKSRRAWMRAEVLSTPTPRTGTSCPGT